MFKLLVVVACIFSLSSAGVVKVIYGGEYDANAGKDIHGAQLSSLAHSSALQAKNAVRNQYTAGSQAAYGIKSSFASAALGAAKTAQAALVGKQAIISNLKQELAEAESQLHAEIALHQQTENAVHAAQESAHQAHTQLNSLTAALAAAQAGVQHAQETAAEAANAAARQQHMVAEAKQRIALLSNQLQNAYAELKDTEASARKAAAAAHIAQKNAAAAGAAVVASGHKGAYSRHH